MLLQALSFAKLIENLEVGVQLAINTEIGGIPW